MKIRRLIAPDNSLEYNGNSVNKGQTKKGNLSMTMHIVLIENSTLTQAESLIRYLKNEGHRVCVSHTPETAASKVKTCWPNLIVVNPFQFDHKLPGFYGAIDQMNLKIPYLVLGDKDNLSPKPETNLFWTAPTKSELLKTIKKIRQQQQDRFVRLSDLVIDCHHYKILRGEESHSLTPKQFKLLHLLLENPDQVLSRKTIMQQVWETDYLGDTRTLDVHIRWLREKIEDNPSQPRRLITVRGVGYHFVSEPE